MFDKTARYYDALYSWKDYPAEAQRVVDFVRQYKASPGNALLDVACGTGKHMEALQESFAVTGLDLDPGLLEIARERYPALQFVAADMRSFELPQRFDVVTCLFSSIGYLTTIQAVRDTFDTFANHLHAGGVALIEPWIFPDQFEPGNIHRLTPDDSDGVSLCRMATTRRDGDRVQLEMHYLIGTADGIEHLRETHHTMMYPREVLQEQLQQAGFDVTWDEEGLMGRGLFIGVRRS
ncbi:MAG: class I SAM-dependent methyltransferase [Planctomycetota bacterium]